MINKTTHNWQIIEAVMFILFCTVPVVFGQTRPENLQHYFFSKKPFIHPKIIEDLENWISDQDEQIVAINIPGSMGTNRYFGDIKIGSGNNPAVTYTDSTDSYCKTHSCPHGPPFFSYHLVGKTDSGIYVLFTKNGGGGGTGVFESLLLISLEIGEGMSYDKKNHTIRINRKRLLIKRLTEITLGDRYIGTITLKGNMLHIGKNERAIQLGSSSKDRDIKIEANQ